MKKYIKNGAVSALVLLLLLGGFAYTAPTVEAGNGNTKRATYQLFGNNGLHLGWYKNGKINNYCWGSCDNDFDDLLELFRQRLEELRNNRLNYYDDTDIDVYTRAADDIDDNSVTLRGEVDLNGEDEAEVYFVWGESRYDLDEETDHTTINDNDDEDFEETITGLDEGERYYYCAVAEDEDGDETYGTIYSFVTDEEDDDEYPDVYTRSANDISDDSADLGGTVDMNDFNNVTVFLVYGEDDDQVEDVSDDYDTYEEIEEDGDDLQKVRFETDLDGEDSYEAEVDDLDDNTKYYFSLCVEFEGEDDDDQILCGAVKSFTTDD